MGNGAVLYHVKGDASLWYGAHWWAGPIRTHQDAACTSDPGLTHCSRTFDLVLGRTDDAASEEISRDTDAAVIEAACNTIIAVLWRKYFLVNGGHSRNVSEGCRGAAQHSHSALKPPPLRKLRPWHLGEQLVYQNHHYPTKSQAGSPMLQHQSRRSP